jgi:serine/threonine protein kinase
MERYKVLKTVGDGTFGSVTKAVNRSTGEVVAIKKMKQKFFSWDECLALREIKSLRKLSHQNIVKLKEVIRVNDELHLVFEFLDQNLYQLMKGRNQPFPEMQIRSLLYQTFSGLAYMHKHGFFHRDLKPENLMATGTVCKIADFGLAREVRSKPPFTDYVSTRWYRAPEIVLRSTNYNSPIDLFAMGCIMVEMYNLRPMAPGANESDQLFKYCGVLGTPSMDTWQEGYRLAAAAGAHFPSCAGVPFATLVPNCCEEGLQLLEGLLHWDPQRRITATQSLAHPYFTNFAGILQNPPSSHGPVSRGLLESRDKDPYASRDPARTNSKWSQGSSHISDKSAKGRIFMKPSVIQPAQYGVLKAQPGGALPKLREVPEVPSEAFLPKKLPGLAPAFPMPQQPLRAKLDDYGEELMAQGHSGKQREPSGKSLPPIANGMMFSRPANYIPAAVDTRSLPNPRSQLGGHGGSPSFPAALPPVQNFSHISNGAALGRMGARPSVKAGGLALPVLNRSRF